MRYCDCIEPLPCMEGVGVGLRETHLSVATKDGGWSQLCQTRPERWETVESEPKPTDDPVIIANTDTPTCEVCAMLLSENLKTYLTASNWPVRWERVL